MIQFENDTPPNPTSSSPHSIKNSRSLSGTKNRRLCVLFSFLLPNAEFYDLPCDEEWEIDRSQLTIKEQLGEGAFGLVMRGDAVGLYDMSGTCSVAVKMLKGKMVHISFTTSVTF